MERFVPGDPAPPAALEDIPCLVSGYYTGDPSGPVVFGTSGHRGSSLVGTFNESHILAIAQAVCDLRKAERIDGPLFLGADTHALSEPAMATTLEVLAANGMDVILQPGIEPLPTPVISRAVLSYNAGRTSGLADAIIITPSHNPPADGGLKYNGPSGGPASAVVTGAVEERANTLMREGLKDVRRLSLASARAASTTHEVDIIAPYVADLPKCIDIERIRQCGLKLGADPMGGASVGSWERIAQVHRLDLTLVNPGVDPTFAFMPLDHDGKIRMDCSSRFAMARLVDLKEHYDVAFGNDPDADRHGIVTRGVGLLNPNHFLAAATAYLLTHRPAWSMDCAIAKTLVTSSMVDRVARAHGHHVHEVPVGFKWFVPGLLEGEIAFAVEESAGASLLQRDGRVWTTDKDGIVLSLLAAEITANTGRGPDKVYAELESRYGRSYYRREDTPATPQEQQVLKRLSSAMIVADTLAGEPITASITVAPGNGAAIGGLKVSTASGWFCARPSGTEQIYKLYAESFVSDVHVTRILEDARGIVQDALQRAGS